MTSTRRQFIKQTVSAAVGASAMSAFPAPFLWAADKTADPSKPGTLVIIYLRGGSDPLNAIVP